MLVLVLTADPSLQVALASMNGDLELRSVDEARAAREAPGAQVVLIDLGTTQRSLEVTRALNSAGVSTPCVVIGREPVDAAEIARVLARPFTLGELRDAIEAAARGPAAPVEEMEPVPAAPVLAEPEPAPEAEASPDQIAREEQRLAERREADVAARHAREVEARRAREEEAAAAAAQRAAEKAHAKEERRAARAQRKDVEARERAAGEEARRAKALAEARERAARDAALREQRAQERAREQEEQRARAAALLELESLERDRREAPAPAPAPPRHEVARARVVPHPPAAPWRRRRVRRVVEDAPASRPSGDPTDTRVREALLAANDLQQVLAELPMLADPKFVAAALVAEIVERLGARTVVVYAPPDDGRFVVLAGHGLSPAESRLRVPIDHAVMREVAFDRRALCVVPLDLARGAFAGLAGAHVEAFMASPLDLGDQGVSVVTAGADDLGEKDLESLCRLASEAAPGLALAHALARVRDSSS